jgi:hypothetical protein
MSKVLWSFVLSTVFCAFLIGEGSADALPPHSDICDGGIVSKKLLAMHIIDLSGNKDAPKLVFGDADLWRTIFTDPQFCPTRKLCRGGMDAAVCSKAAAACDAAQNAAVGAAEEFFQDVNLETAKPKATYVEDASLRSLTSDAARMRKYFSSPADTASRITCTATDVPAPPPPSAAEKSPFRVRGDSDDLYVARSKDAFKSTSQATITFSGDRSDVPTQTIKAKGALGYAYQVNNSTVAIPYISYYQSITDTFGKPQSTDPASNVAAGLLFTSSYEYYDLVNNVFNVKPQYLLNTKDHSEIESVRLIYTPYTLIEGSPNLNKFQRIGFSPIPLYAQILFDTRVDAGAYRNRGNDPVQSLLNKDFLRAGSRFGFALTSDIGTSSVTLVVAETCLYGFYGTVRNLSVFDASLTYSLDPKKYFGLTAAYRNGIDEDTAIRVETWTVGLSAKF